MKFLVTKDLGHSQLLGYLMGTVVLTIVLYLILDVFVHGYILGWNFDTILTTLYGNAETFEEPILIDSLLLQVHLDLFMGIFSLLILTSMWIRFCTDTLRLKWILHAVLIAALSAPLSLLAAYMSSSLFVTFWLVTFFLWHVLAIVISMMVFKKLRFR